MQYFAPIVFRNLPSVKQHYKLGENKPLQQANPFKRQILMFHFSRIIKFI